MNPRAPLFALLVSALAAGCSTPPQQLATSGPARSFEVPLPSDQAWRRVVQGARGCYPRHAVDADFFPDTRAGRVTLSVKTDLNVATLFVADVSPAGGGATVRVAYFVPDFADAVQQWAAQGDYTLCPFG